MINFRNDYLGLSEDPRVRDAAKRRLIVMQHQLPAHDLQRYALLEN
jgi:7-keto-8-aminopelargonate synthetase-like enzyme